MLSLFKNLIIRFIYKLVALNGINFVVNREKVEKTISEVESINIRRNIILHL
jgi:hypothetical protein